MAGPAPIEVGARGTIGSLVSQEIEYFKKNDEKPKLDIADMASTMVEVAETKLDMMVAAGYWSLKTDAKRSPRD
ncbi:hypothetical protein QJS10_CPA09g01221 [Acorus calamus]|uniref:Uncharacterized protein n=1 Tax=Acorus calamus TaxID=4465 RepID=A0AAV9E3E8_ACOCL|nr:hypothetical protein QJS10_CPA09g01221 [Acorus calamus]